MKGVLIKNTSLGRRAYPIDLDEADTLVQEGAVTKLKNRIYEENLSYNTRQMKADDAPPPKPKKKAKKKTASRKGDK